MVKMMSVVRLLAICCLLCTMYDNCFGESIKRLFKRISVKVGMQVEEHNIPMVSHKVHVGCSVEIGSHRTTIVELCEKLKVRMQKVGGDMHRAAMQLCCLWTRLREYMQENPSDAMIIASAVISVAILSAYLINKMHKNARPKVCECWHERVPLSYDFEVCSHNCSNW